MLTELRAASALHNRMLAAVMTAPMHFFDSTPVGRVLNRFSNDQESLDSTLPRTVNQLFSCAMRVGGTVGMICFVSPAFIPVILPVALMYWQVWMLACLRGWVEHLGGTPAQANTRLEGCEAPVGLQPDGVCLEVCTRRQSSLCLTSTTLTSSPTVLR